MSGGGYGLTRPPMADERIQGVRNQKIVNHDLPAEQILRQAGIHEPHENQSDRSQKSEVGIWNLEAK